MPKRHLVVSYDVVEDRRRIRLAAFLKNFMDRVQKSVFEGPVAEIRLEKLREGVGELIDRECDSVRIYTLCRRCREATEVVGVGVYIEPERPGDVLV